MKKQSGPIKLGKVVRRLREEKGFSQEELAYQCKLHRNYIGAVERGETNIGLQNIVAVANSLGLKAWELLKQSVL